MSIYSNENIRKIVKLSPHEFPHLVQNRKNTGTRKLWRIQYLYQVAKKVSCFIMWEHYGVVVRALDLLSEGRGFESHSVRMPFDEAFCPQFVSLAPGVVNG